MPALPRCEIWLSAVAAGMRKPVRNTGALGREQEVTYVQVIVWTNGGWTEPRICHINNPDLAAQVLRKETIISPFLRGTSAVRAFILCT